MNKESDNNKEQYPIEFPSRKNETKRSPIVDVVNNETFPLELSGSRHHSGVHIDSFNDVTEVVATEIEPDTAEQTTREQ